MKKEQLKESFKLRIYKWTLSLIKALDGLTKDNSSSIIVSQCLRSGTSIGANYIEAQAASSKKDFINFFHYSLKSANETKFWLALLRDSGKMKRADVNYLLNELSEVSRILASSLLTLKKKT